MLPDEKKQDTASEISIMYLVWLAPSIQSSLKGDRYACLHICAHTNPCRKNSEKSLVSFMDQIVHAETIGIGQKSDYPQGNHHASHL